MAAISGCHECATSRSTCICTSSSAAPSTEASTSMTREQLKHCFDSLPPEVRVRLAEKAGAFQGYLEKAGTVRVKLASEFPTIDRRAATVVSLVVARFL